jgi:hypothetical protein
LRATLGEHRPADGPDGACDLVVERLAGGALDDDVAVLAVTVQP